MTMGTPTLTSLLAVSSSAKNAQALTASAMPANALTSIISVLLGRWKLVTSTSTTWNAKPGVMKMLVSPEAWPVFAQDSSVRTVVVPTATTRPPRWRQRSSAASVARGISYHSLCIWCSARFSVLQGWKVPAPTCNVTLARSMPRAAMSASTPSSKCSAGGGAEGGRERGVAGAVNEFRGRFARRAVQGKAEQRAVLGGPAAQQLRVKAARLAATSHVHHAAGQGLLADLHVGHDFITRVASLCGQHAFDQQLQLAAAGLLAKDACLDHARVVEDEQVALAQQAGQLAKDAVHRLHGAAVQQARGAAFGRGVLGNEFGGQREVEVAEGEHAGCCEGAGCAAGEISHCA